MLKKIITAEIKPKDIVEEPKKPEHPEDKDEKKKVEKKDESK